MQHVNLQQEIFSAPKIFANIIKIWKNSTSKYPAKL